MFEIKIVDTVEYRCEQSYQKKEEFITINAEFLYENESVCNGRLCFYKINEALGKIFF